ncbi:hypothetical protein FGJ01_10215 [Hydrogenophaga intermedia]|nr:hypothetical protein FGJ01_10215 [Hydrogenophaga intermedia]
MARCPCCGCRTKAKPCDDEICPVCFWQDDGQDDLTADEVWGGPNDELSLSQARLNFAKFGASSEAWKWRVRPPNADELDT